MIRTGRFFAVMVIGWVMLSSISYGYSGWIAGKTGNALAFDGVNDYVEVAGYQGILGTQSRTCCAWIKTTAVQQGNIVSWGAEQSGRRWSFRTEADGTLAVGVFGGQIYTTAKVNDGQWHHVAAVLNDDGSPSVNEILFYIDGVLQAATANSTQIIVTSASQNVVIGAFKNAGVPATYFNGLLDEVCVYGRALEASELNPDNPIPTEGLVAHWAMDEGGGVTAYDMISSYHGLLKSMSYLYERYDSGWRPGKTGYAFKFDGTNDYVEVAGYKGITGTVSRTCSAWIKTSATQLGNIISWGAEQNGQRWSFRMESNGTLGVGVYGGQIFTTAAVNDGQWHHVAVVLNDDGSPNVNEIHIYIDGAVQAATVTGSQSIDTAASQNVMIGAFKSSGVPNAYYKGLIDDVCVYTRALGADELDPDNPIPTEGLIARWAMDKAGGTVAYDSVSHYDGVLRFMISGYSGGGGTPDDPYQIASKEDLLELGVFEDDYDKSFILTQDIDLAGQIFIGAIIGRLNRYPNYFLDDVFTGTFDGNGYKVKNFTITATEFYSNECLGVFGIIGNKSQIRNLGIVNFSVIGSSNSFGAGGLAGYSDKSDISNCYSSGIVSGFSGLGGLVGHSKGGTVHNCYSTSNINGRSFVGGLVGSKDYGVFTNCHATGSVTGTGDNVGGLVGSNGRGELINCYSAGFVQGVNNVGGLTGMNYGAHVKDCYSLGRVQGVSYVGGLTGSNADVHDNPSTSYPSAIFTITSCYSSGQVLGDSHVGGLTGDAHPLRVTGCFWDTQTSGQTSGGGGTGKTTAQMQSHLTFTSAGWNFGPWIIGKTGNALSLNGLDESVEVPGYKGIVGTQSRTCCAWIKTIAAQQGNIISWGAEQNGQRWSFRTEANGTLAVGVSGGQIYTTATVNDGQWHHVAAILNDDGSPSVDEILFYIDGVLQATTANSTQSVDTMASQDVVIGAFKNSGVPATYFNGLLDEVCIYGRALEPNEIDPEGPIPTEGLISHWAMDEDNDTVVHDSVSSNHGLLNNIPGNSSGWFAGKTDNALAFDGVDDYVKLLGYRGITGTSSRTCCAWIKTVSAQQGSILYWGGDENGQKWFFRIEADGTLAMGVGGGYVYTAATVNNGQWHHVAAVLNNDGSPSVNEILIYIDGVPQNTSATSTQSINTLGSNYVMIGAYQNEDTPAGYFKGMIDEVCIYNLALKATEINPLGPTTTNGLIAHWKMNETKGINVHDSVSSYDGIIFNSIPAEWALCEGTNYPRLVWQISDGDFACPDGVSAEDLDYFVGRWLLNNCTSSNNYCGGGDINSSGVVDLADFSIFAQHWLEL